MSSMMSTFHWFRRKLVASPCNVMRNYHINRPSCIVIEYRQSPNLRLSSCNFSISRKCSTFAAENCGGDSARRSRAEFPTFVTMIEHYKHSSRCSFVIEDCSRKAFLWHRPDAEIIRSLFSDSSPRTIRCRLWRWRTSNTFDGKIKRFLLAEFDDTASLKCAINHLHRKHRIRLYDRVGFVAQHHIDSMKSEIESEQRNKLESSYRILVRNEQSKTEATYSIVHTPNDNDNNNNIDNDDNNNLKNNEEDDQNRNRIKFDDYNPPSATSKCRPSSPLVPIGKLLRGKELLSELQFKLRFFVAHQIELLLRKHLSSLISSTSTTNKSLPYGRNKLDGAKNDLIDRYEIIPFGSEVSGFGTGDSDLDLCLTSKSTFNNSNNSRNIAMIDEGESNDGKIRFHRSIRMLQQLSIILQQSVKFQENFAHSPSPPSPHVSRIQTKSSSPLFFRHNHFHRIERIFRAFVPIIKCRSHLLPSLNIDISADTERNSGVSMAAYLYTCAYGGDARVRPFVYTLKAWAKHHNIVKEIPGEWFSSFQITSLGIAFLQSRQIIPGIDEWEKQRRRRISTSNPLSLSLSLSRLSSESDNNDPKSADIMRNARVEDVSHLLEQFFQFMVRYNFWKHAFDLRTGRCDAPKRYGDRDACYIVNPFAPHLNICKTITEQELERFLSYCQQSVEILAQNCDSPKRKLESLFNVLDDRLHSINY